MLLHRVFHFVCVDLLVWWVFSTLFVRSLVCGGCVCLSALTCVRRLQQQRDLLSSLSTAALQTVFVNDYEKSSLGLPVRNTFSVFVLFRYRELRPCCSFCECICWCHNLITKYYKLYTQRFMGTGSGDARELDRLNSELYVFVTQQLQAALSRVCASV